MLRRALLTFALGLALTAAPAAARQAPVAALSGPAVLKAHAEATFDAGSSTHDPAGSIVEYAWDVDGTGRFAIKRTSPRLTVTLDDPGDITISVRVTDDAGTSSIAEGHFLVEGPPPVARITVPSPVVAGSPVVLDASTSSAPAGHLVAYAWDLDGAGFGPDGTETSVTTTFPRPGSYPVVLRVRDQAHGEDTILKTIEVVDPASLIAQTATGTIGGDPAAGILALDTQAVSWIRPGSAKRFAAVNGAAKRRIATVRRRGLWVNLISDRAAAFTVNLFVARDVARVLRLTGARVGKQVRIGRVTMRMRSAGQMPMLILLSPHNRKALRAPIQLYLRGAAVDGAGRRAALSRAFALRR
jgi:hypothetical protein